MQRGVGALCTLIALAGCSLTPAEAPPPAAADTGARLFLENCASCHGTYGEGNGPVAPALSVVMQDLRYLAARNGGRFVPELVREIIDGRDSPTVHGGRDMPVWGIAFRPDGDDTPEADRDAAAKIDALVEFLARIQVPGAG